MYKKILVPHAGTQAGDLALKHATTIAKTESNCRIILLHVVEKMPYPPTIGMGSGEVKNIHRDIDGVAKEIKENMEMEFRKKTAEHQKKGLKIESIIVVGYPFDEIIKVVKKERPDIIVMAKRRKLTGFRSILALGSVSRKVAERVPCPILFVDSNAEKK